MYDPRSRRRQTISPDHLSQLNITCSSFVRETVFLVVAAPLDLFAIRTIEALRIGQQNDSSTCRASTNATRRSRRCRCHVDRDRGAGTHQLHRPVRRSAASDGPASGQSNTCPLLWRDEGLTPNARSVANFRKRATHALLAAWNIQHHPEFCNDVVVRVWSRRRGTSALLHRAFDFLPHIRYHLFVEG